MINFTSKPPRPALRQTAARSARSWRPLLVAAAVTLIVGMLYGSGRSMQPALPPTPTVATTPADGRTPTGGGTTPADGWNLELTATRPRVLNANPPEDWNSYENNEDLSGQLLYNDDCECFVLFEDGADGVATMVAWLDGVGFTEGGKHGVAPYHALSSWASTEMAAGQRMRRSKAELGVRTGFVRRSSVS